MVQMTPERERVRSYLVSQAEKKTFAELTGVVEEARSAFLAEIEGVSEAQARFKPRRQALREPQGGPQDAALRQAQGAAPAGDEEDWSIAEVLRHVIQSEEGLAARIRALAGGESGRGPVAGRLAGHEGDALPELVAALRSSRGSLSDAVSAVAGRERLDTTAPHPFFGELNCRAWFLFQRVHDNDHTGQVKKIKADPAYPKPSA